MKIVVDTNIVFSAILNSSSRIATILLHSGSKLSFYTTEDLLFEIEEHRDKLKKLTSLSDFELSDLISTTIYQIKFIDLQSVPFEIYLKSKVLTADVDIDDTAFVALAEHLNAKLWTGDKVLINGLTKKGWENLFQQMNCLKSFWQMNSAYCFYPPKFYFSQNQNNYILVPSICNSPKHSPR